MIGALRQRIELLRPQRLADGGGGWEVGYQSVGSIAAGVEGRRARSERSLDSRRTRRRRRFTIRTRPDLVFEMRIAHGGRHYRIVDIQPLDQGGRFTRIEAEEIPA